MSKPPALIVFSSLFPNSAQPNAGLFIRERLFRVGQHLPLVVVSPKPWFPGQELIRRFRPHYRPMPGHQERQDGIDVLFPRFLALPGLLRNLDSLSMALGSYPTLLRLKKQGYNLIDAHFAYPDGHSAVRLGQWLGLPVTVTLRGTEVPHSRNPKLRPRMREVFSKAKRVIAVSDSLKRLAIGLGMPPDKGVVVGNGVDTQRFQPVDRNEARARLGLPAKASVLISVGALVERKGFHRVIDCLPTLLARHPDLHYLIVGGSSPEGDNSAALRQQVDRLHLVERVHFLGALPPDALKWPFSAADIFVLASSNEGWANVILEAMACGLPVVATDVGGNREVVATDDLGIIVPFDDQAALVQALDKALGQPWERETVLAYARANAWDERVSRLLDIFSEGSRP
ncbi:glycosyltransferase [Thiocystis violascens]|uniref:Glycosyltransferase n=1 Tax=Thiocystis violascens (strain ATCC 17096 / DSM 198 / 6111) TaxID=765911 RepID=I3YFU0_THIV6|nr:glycosyltransferase [Thiocystis violascens]AFL75858.1 glycosyltransferase [Thiocystis violascens DSM 198]